MVDYLKHNNQNGEFDELIRKIAKMEDPKFSEVLALIGANSKPELAALKEFVNNLHKNPNDNILQDAMDFLKNNNQQKYRPLKNQIKNAQGLQLGDLLDLHDLHNKNGELAELDAILNQSNKPSPLQEIRDWVAAQPDNAEKQRYQDLLGEVDKITNPKMSDLLRILNNKNLKDGEFDGLLDKINNKGFNPGKILALLDKCKTDLSVSPLQNYLQSAQPKVSELLELIDKNNKRGELNDLKRKVDRRLLDPDLLGELAEEYVEGDKKLSPEEKQQLLRKLKQMVNDAGNGAGAFSDLVGNLKKDPKNDGLVQHINDRLLPKSDLRDFVEKLKNKDDIENLKNEISGDKNLQLTDLIDLIDDLNKNGQLDLVKQYLLDPEALTPNTKLLELLDRLQSGGKGSAARSLLDSARDNSLDNVYELLDYLKHNNQDNKHDSVISRLQSFIRSNAAKTNNPVLRQLVGSQLQKLWQAFSRLMRNSQGQSLRKRGREGQIRLLLEKLQNSCRSLQRQGLSALRENRSGLEQEHRERERVRGGNLRGLVRAQNQKLISCLRTFRDFRSGLRSKEKEMQKAIDLRLKSNYLRTLRQTLFKLRMFNLNKSHDQYRAVSTVVKNVLRDQAHFFRKLQMRNKMQNLLKKYFKVQKMMMRVKQNNFHFLRAKFDHWSQKNKKQHAIRIRDLITKVILLNKKHGYDQIRINRDIQIYGKYIKGILFLIEKKRAFDEKRKREAMNELIERFVDRNPWFKQIVKLWVFQTQPVLQTTFWKMREQEDLREGNVSAQVSLKLKNVVHALNKHILKEKSFAFF